MKIEIKSKKAYEAVMVEIYQLMTRGDGYLSRAELSRFRELTTAAEQYELAMMAV